MLSITPLTSLQSHLILWSHPKQHLADEFAQQRAALNFIESSVCQFAAVQRLADRHARAGRRGVK